MSAFNFLRGPGNVHLDLARVIGASASIFYPAPFLWAVVAHGVTPDPASFGTGYAAVLASIGAMICAKDIGVAKAGQIGATNAQ